MKIYSNSFEHNSSIDKEFTCEGINISPDLHWESEPAGTNSFALIVEDPDAPSPEAPRETPWVHWIVFNLPVQIKSLEKNMDVATIGAKTGTTDSGRAEYHGPCPPQGSGIHRYFFKLYALDKLLDLKMGTTKQQLLDAMIGHVLDTVEIIGIYVRPIN